MRFDIFTSLAFPLGVAAATWLFVMGRAAYASYQLRSMTHRESLPLRRQYAMRLYADAAAVAGVLILTGVLSGIWVYIYCGAGLAVVASSLFAWPYLSGVSVSRRAGERSSRVGAGYGSTVQAPSQDSSS